MRKVVAPMRHGKNVEDWSLGDAVPLDKIGVEQVRNSTLTILSEIGNLGNVVVVHSGIVRAAQTYYVAEDTIREQYPNAKIVGIETPWINGTEIDDFFKIFYLVFRSNEIEKIAGFDPDTIMFITHAHNPIGTMLNAAIDYHSMLIGFPEHIQKRLIDSFNSPNPANFDERASYQNIRRGVSDKNFALRPYYAAASVYTLPIQRWTDFDLYTGTRKIAFSPYVVA